MKKAILFFALIFTVSFISAQKENSKMDTTKLKIGGKTIMIIENESKDSKELKEIKKEKDDKVIKATKKNKYKVKKYSRWAGLNVGFNSFGERNDLPESDDIDLFDINPFRSKVWNLNILEYSLSIVDRHLLLTTGLGFEFRNYRFNNSVDFIYDQDDKIDLVVNKDVEYDKNKLKMSFVQVPLLLEINTSKRAKKGLYFAFGVVGGYRMTTSLNQEFVENGLKTERKIRNSFNYNPFQANGTIRIGINKFTLISSFDLLPMFKDNSSKVGETLVPVSLGIQLVGF